MGFNRAEGRFGDIWAGELIAIKCQILFRADEKWKNRHQTTQFQTDFASDSLLLHILLKNLKR